MAIGKTWSEFKKIWMSMELSYKLFSTLFVLLVILHKNYGANVTY